MSRQPWMKFFPADWQSDVLLRSCSIAARGLWIELLCIMQKAEPVGHLLVNGKAPAPSLLAVLCGTSEKEIRRLLGELRAAGVFDEAEGIIVSRRMVRDAEKAERDKANGRRGGNPAVKAGVNPPVKPPVERRDKAHIPEARSQKPEARRILLVHPHRSSRLRRTRSRCSGASIRSGRATTRRSRPEPPMPQR